MESPNLPELPECPVCLQYFDGASTTPRVLPCGHSACETCLSQLPNPFPQTIRCPACTQLVKHPHNFSFLPKNIDLLRLSSLLQQQNPDYIHSKPKEPTKQLALEGENDHLFIPNLWGLEFYNSWKDWVLMEECVLVDQSGVCGSVLFGKMVGFGGYFGLPTRCLWQENQVVCLMKVGVLRNDDDDIIVYSYVSKIMRVLYGMRDCERDELGLILRASLKWSRICKVYGLWYNKDDQGLYVVCESKCCKLLDKLDCLENGFAGIVDEDKGLRSDVSLSFFMTGMEICEAVMDLHSEGLSFGSLSLSYFSFDSFGHAYVEISEVIMMCVRLNEMITISISDKLSNCEKEVEVILNSFLVERFTFVSPEVFELLLKEGASLGPYRPRYVVGYNSDVWSLACALIWFLIGKPFIEVFNSYILCLLLLFIDKDSPNCEVMYMDWLEKVRTLLNSRMKLECMPLKSLLLRCLHFDSGMRPDVLEIWKCMRGMQVNLKYDMFVSSKQTMTKKNIKHCFVQGKTCELINRISERSDNQMRGVLQEECEGVEQVKGLSISRDLIEGLPEGHVKSIELKGHLDCITALAVGGGFLFSSSFDKTVQLWSLEDFTHIHSFRGHEHKVMAVVFVDEGQPLCISGDNGGGICIWGISIPFREEPIKKLGEEKDWRYSGIHALTISGTGYFYTGNGDRSIKVWSMQNYTLSCTLTGHKSVVSTLAVCNGVLYSGSWDGTVRLWSLSDHSPLTILGGNSSGSMTSVLSVSADQNMLVVADESGHIKIWKDNLLIKSTAAQEGAIFSVSVKAMLIFTGGWSKTVMIQQLQGDNTSMDVIPVGSIACDSVITALTYWKGMLIVGQADRTIKVYHYGE